MTEEKARELLRHSIDGKDLHDIGWYLAWKATYPDWATLDGTFSADDLEAIAWWMRHNAEPKA